MTQEDKNLLLKDLCSRLPYGVKIFMPDLWTQKREVEILDEIFKGDDGLYRVNSKGQCIEYVKPYLFPLSSMTEEQVKEYDIMYEENRYSWRENIIDWFHKNHFDYRCLIEKGLAIDATGKNIY